MKTYAGYLNEISSDDIREGLLGFGMFADKIPDFLSSEKFYEYSRKKNFPNYTQSNGWDYIRYESMRNTNIPRNLSIPTPFSYANICNCIHDNWNELLKYFNDKTQNNRYKHSKIHIQKHKGEKTLFKMSSNYCDVDPDYLEKLQKLQINYHYKVVTDISNCFPSIYSHSIPWALEGKANAKRDQFNKQLWFNNLDKNIRKMKYNETTGLLIGPHSSNLISEIILVSIDYELEKLGYDFYRCIDDYTCYVDDEEKAEKFILDLAKELKKFDLSLNTKKTRIIKLPISSSEDWVCALNKFYIGDTRTKNGNIVFKLARLKSFLDMGITLAKSSGNSAVYSYIIKIVSSTYLGKLAKSYYINIMHHLLLMYPYLVHFFDEYIIKTFELSNSEIKEISEDLYIAGISKTNFEACSFAIYWSIKYGFKIDIDNIAENAIKSEDCILLLLSYIYLNHNNDKVGQNLLTAHAQKISYDFDCFWLFLYEILPKQYLQKQNNYKKLKNSGITFLKQGFRII